MTPYTEVRNVRFTREHYNLTSEYSRIRKFGPSHFEDFNYLNLG